MNKIIDWIMESESKRWILFFPLALICMFLSNVATELINWLFIRERIFSSEGVFYNFYNMTISGLITGYVFIYVGGYISPKKSGITFLKTLLIIISVITIIGNVFMFEDKDYWICLFVIFTLIGGQLAQNSLENKE